MPRCSIMWDLVVVVFVPPAEMRCADHPGADAMKRFGICQFDFF